MAPGMHEDGGFGCTRALTVQHLLPEVPARGVLSELIQTYAERINDVAPVALEVLGPCGREDVRIWHINEARAAAHQGAQRECLSVASSSAPAGRRHRLERRRKSEKAAETRGGCCTGRDGRRAHGVTCLVGSGDCGRIVSGGEGHGASDAVPDVRHRAARFGGIHHAGRPRVQGAAADRAAGERRGKRTAKKCLKANKHLYVLPGGEAASTFFNAARRAPRVSQVVTGEARHRKHVQRPDSGVRVRGDGHVPHDGFPDATEESADEPGARIGFLLCGRVGNVLPRRDAAVVVGTP